MNLHFLLESNKENDLKANGNLLRTLAYRFSLWEERNVFTLENRYETFREEIVSLDYDEILEIIVLNSISSLWKCMERLACYIAIHCCLDNDKAGLRATEGIMERYPKKVCNEAMRYAEYKDVNDYLIGRRSINIAVE